MASAEDKTTNVEALCEAKKLRMTGQRRIIAQVLSAAKDHPDVEEVYSRASAVDKQISLSTVYRTVRLFEEEGILERHDFGDGRARYEQVGRKHHDHLINTGSGEVIEFYNEELEKLQVQIATSLGYKLTGHKMELYGVPLKKKTEG